ncbi:GIP, partial [Symbiodinium sp. CCMP2456]
TSTPPSASPMQVSTGKGPSEKLLVPSFSGEPESGDLGASARSYLRQIAAWERMTTLRREQRALVLYQHLQGAAWINAESLEVDRLGGPDGIEYFRGWIEQHYLDIEVTLIGKSLSDLFRRLRRRPQQSFRDYAAEFNRLLARVTECGCALPDTATAWLFVDRASLDESTEVSLLASVGNKYALRQLQQAAIILDRSMRKPWEKNTQHSRRPQQANMTDEVHDGSDAEEGDESPPEYDTEGQDNGDLYVAYMTAKAKYRDAGKNRGIDLDNVKKSAEEKVKLAKQRSHCAACGQRGHWHRDPECPKKRSDGSGGSHDRPKVQTVNVVHEVYELSSNTEDPLYAITDSACSKSVMGTGWMQRYIEMAKTMGVEVPIVYEKESFKFGASRVYESNYAAMVTFAIGHRWVIVKAAVVHGDVPLLISRPVLAEMGTVLDIANNTATFSALGVQDHKLIATSSGHPAVLIGSNGLQKPSPESLPKAWDAKEVAILSPCRAYTSFVAESIQSESPSCRHTSYYSAKAEIPKLFFEKRIDPGIRNMLIADTLNLNSFLAWWSSTPISNDFWIECEDRLVRVHVVPRKYTFNPSRVRPTTLCQLYGSAAALSFELLPGRPYEILLVMSAPWKMNKSELLQECVRRGIPTSSKWTVAELRHVLTADNKGVEDPMPTGLSSMSLAQLRSEAQRIGLEYGTRETRGALMLRIRDHVAPDQTVMTLGRFKGSFYKDVPEQYGDWASEEERANPNMHPDLRRYVNWRRYQKETQAAAYSTATASSMAPEINSKIPPPPLSETGYSNNTWDVVSSEMTLPIPPRATQAKAKAAASKTAPRTRVREEEQPRRMEQEIEPEVLTEIEMLEMHADGATKGKGIGEIKAGDLVKIQDNVKLGEVIYQDEEQEIYESCVSDNEDDYKEDLASPDEVHVYLTTKHHEKAKGQRPGEDIAKQAIQDGDFTYERLEKVIQEAELKTNKRVRKLAHGNEASERYVFGLYGYG